MRVNKRYTNLTREMQHVVFTDGSAQFLKRGQSFTSDKDTAVIQEGVTVEDILEVRNKKTATSEASQ
jgi:hypothetical protein